MDYCHPSRRGRAAAALLLAVALGAGSGCASTGPGTPAAARLLDPGDLAPGRDLAEAELSGRWPDAEWWRDYRDPQLDALVGEALARSPRLAVAAARIRQAESLAGVARAATLPSAQLAGAATRTRLSAAHGVPPPVGGSWQWNAALDVGLSYELDLWGRHRSALAGALDGVQVAAYEARAARLALVGALVRAYSELALQLELRGSAEAVLADHERTREVARRRVAAGIGTELAVRQSETEIATTRAELERLDARATALRHQLAALTGAGPGAGDGIRRPALRLEGVEALPSRLPAELVGRRPDVLASRWRVEGAARGIDVARAAFYPNVDLAAFAGLLSFGFSRLFTADAVEAGAGPALSLPLFEGGRLRAGLEGSTADYDAAVGEYDATVVDAVADVVDQIAALRSLRREQAERQVAVASAERAHALAQEAYRAGIGDYLDTLQTEVALQAQRDVIARIRFAQLATRAALNQALGGGAPDAAPPLAAALPAREGPRARRPHP
ncbi:MAG TPA: efflux transporter outer membrane subunit [Anaeromyxobacteraceae bacterium]|nr:efflux transporter outer membrane subunit [Anaeromyxobacteraceae bacterium]